LAQRPDGSTVAEFRGQGFAPDAQVTLEKKILGIWVLIPHVDGFPPNVGHNGSFKAEMPTSLATTGEYALSTVPASSRDAFLQVLDVQSPDHPGRCTIDQIAN
jgi:hypothetical protein